MFVPGGVRVSAAAPAYTFPVQRVVVTPSDSPSCAAIDVGFNGTLEAAPAMLTAPFSLRFRLQVLVTKIYGDAVLDPVTGLTVPMAAPMVQITDAMPVVPLAARFVGPLTPGGYNVAVTLIALDAPGADFDIRPSGALSILVA
jgi:hypothetical protein